MNKDSAEEFNNLLSWLDPDRERAGEKYESIRHSLIKIFSWRRVPDPEALADETILRVTRRVAEIRENYEGDPSRYFYGVARNVLREELRQSSRRQSEPKPDEIAVNPPEDPSREELYDCLEKCMSELSPASREMVLMYYEVSREGKFNTRDLLAAQLGLKPSTLRMRMHRIRTTLENCIEACLKVTSA